MKRLGRIGKREDRGAALVEAALVLPILLLLTFGIWTTARAWNVGNTLAHAAREGARYGATVDPWDGSSPGAIQAVVDADLDSADIDPGLVTDCVELIAPGGSPTGPNCDTSHVNNTGTDQVYVQLKYANYDLNFLFFSADIDLDSTAVSRFEASS